MTPRRPIRVMRIIARMNVGGPARQIAALHDPITGLGSCGFEQVLLAGTVSEDETDEVLLRSPSIDASRVAGLGRAPHPVDDLRALRALRTELRRFRPDIVHTHTAKAGILGRLAAWSVRPAPMTVHTFHGHLLSGYFRPSARAGVITAERLMAKGTSRFVSVGSRVRDELVAAGVGREQQYTVIPPGVALPPAPPRDEARARFGLTADSGLVIGFAGRLAGIKRPDRMLAAVAELRERQVAATVLVAGQGALEQAMRDQVTSLGLSDRVRFVGLRADMEVFWAACDTAVVTSDNEGMPMALIEAAMAGRPAVTTDVGSAAEVVRHEETGLVVPPRTDAIAGALARLAGDPELRRRFGAAAKERAAREFPASRLVATTAAMYRELVSEKR